MAHFTLDELRELWSEMKGKPSEQSQLFRDIHEAKEAYLTHNILPELLKWLEQTTVPEIVPALNIYAGVIMADENTRKPIANRLMAVLSQATRTDSDTKQSIQANVANFLHDIATTANEVQTLITYYRDITKWTHRDSTAYHTAIRHLRALIAKKTDLIAPDVRTQLNNFLQNIPDMRPYQLKYRVRGPVSVDEGTTIIEAENESQAREKAMAYMRHFDDGYGGSQKEILSITKIT